MSDQTESPKNDEETADGQVTSSSSVGIDDLTQILAKNDEETADGQVTSSSSAGIDDLTQILSDKLLLDNEPDVCNPITIDTIVDNIKSGDCKNIVTMVGAGISTAAGIPDFRSPGSGLYDNLKKYNLPFPEAIFVLDYFLQDSKPFFDLARELLPGTFKPTLSHYFIKLLNDKELLLRHYTQNIDSLERLSGLPEDILVEAHGTFNTGHCLGCRKKYTFEWMKEQIFNDNVPTCTVCPGVVKPDIVFFGENLPQKFYKCMQQDFRKCDLLIIMGSSLTVQPFGTLIHRVKKSCPRLLINRELAGDLAYKENDRDIIMLGDCDEQCQILADKLGWGDELKKLVEEHKTCDKSKEE